ncbi:MAG: discoidin domain-containing protein [Acidobacteriota bacterium]|nr:discoidin domain-containing protein [Acidobacteriota bacterium]
MTIGRIAAFAALVGIGWAGAHPPALTAAEPETRSIIQETDKEELKLVLPKPMFVGTPRNIRTPNLEVITGKPRGPFFVPKGTVLLSLNKPVTSSDPEPVIGELSFITDGEKSGEDGYFVELGPGTHWVQIDLGKTSRLHAILVWHYHSQARVYRDVVIQVSDDPDFVAGVTTIFNNDHDNSSGLGVGKDKEYIETNEGRLFDPKGVESRYIRLYSAGNTANDMNHYVEVEIYGIPVK